MISKLDVSLLMFAKEVDEYLDGLTTNYASEFVRLKTIAFFGYHWFEVKKKNGDIEYDYLICISLGTDYFKKIIKYWDNPESFYSPENPQYEPGTKGFATYNKNFVELLKLNKNR